LPGDDGYRPGLREARDQSIPGILRFQNSCYGRTSLLWISNLTRRGSERFPMVRIVAVKARNLIEMIGDVGE
jgi:hypothetical protein